MNRTLQSIVTARLKDERGVTIIIVAVLIAVFIALTALAIDGFHLYVVRNELQNAADAGALAGARVLYNEYGTVINEGANQIAFDAARENKALAETGGAIAVDVNWQAGQNSGVTVDVQRGHWSFATHTFTANDSLDVVDLWDVSTEDLDANTDFINAVRVVARRQTTPAASFFARIFGYENFEMWAEAIGYIGFAGTLDKGDADQPIAICRESLITGEEEEEEYSCNIGRMINSGQQVASSETGGWTSFNQDDDACTGGTNAQEVRSLVCGQGNVDTITLGSPVATNGGEIQSAFNDLIDCWHAHLDLDPANPKSWNLTLPVIDCPGNNVGTCEEVRGAVNINIIWITGAGEDPEYNDAPTKMDDWSEVDNPDGSARWDSFVGHFHLQNVDGSPAPYQKKAIYFLPDCTPHELKGRSGGENFGVLARIPVLVK